MTDATGPEKPWTALDAYFAMMGDCRECLADERILPLYRLAVERAIERDGIGIVVTTGSERRVFAPRDAVPRDHVAAMLEPGRNEGAGHVLDWIAASLKNDAPWLSRTDREGRPVKLLKIGSMDRAVREADKAMLRNLASAGGTLLSEGDETVHADLGRGWTLVRMRTPASLDLESQRMQHCIGQGAYDDRLAHGTMIYLSLRDPKGNPHATVEIDGETRQLKQLQGKQNEKPVGRYLKILRPWLLDNVSAPVDQDPTRVNASSWWTGTVRDADGARHDADRLPDELTLPGMFEFLPSSGMNVPRNRVVSPTWLGILANDPYVLPLVVRSESLSLTGGTAALPQGASLSVNRMRLHRTTLDRLRLDAGRQSELTLSGGSSLGRIESGSFLTIAVHDGLIDFVDQGVAIDALKVRSGRIGRLPNGLTIRILELADATVGSLPSGLTVTEGLEIGRTDLVELPSDLRIEKDLTLAGAGTLDGRGIVLPRGLRVGRTLFVHGRTEGLLPDDLHVGGNADIEGFGGPLPDGMNVGGNLSIDGRQIRHLPADLVVGFELRIHCPDVALPTIAEGARIGGRIVVGRQDAYGRIEYQTVPRSEFGTEPQEDPSPRM